jgi:hypothetical protein
MATYKIGRSEWKLQILMESHNYLKNFLIRASMSSFPQKHYLQIALREWMWFMVVAVAILYKKVFGKIYTSGLCMWSIWYGHFTNERWQSWHENEVSWRHKTLTTLFKASPSRGWLWHLRNLCSTQTLEREIAKQS